MPLTRSSCFYVSSLFFLVAVTGICIFASAYDVIFQIFHPANPGDPPDYKNLAVFGGSYVFLGLLATIFGFSRYVTVKLARQAIPKTYMPITQEDLPKTVYEFVQSELDRVARLAKKAEPLLEESGQPGWGKPESSLQDTHFKTFMSSTPHFIERAAVANSPDLARPPNMSISTYIHMLIDQKLITRDIGLEYIAGYEQARFGGARNDPVPTATSPPHHPSPQHQLHQRHSQQVSLRQARQSSLTAATRHSHQDPSTMSTLTTAGATRPFLRSSGGGGGGGGAEDVEEEDYIRFMKVLTWILQELGWDQQAEEAYEEECREQERIQEQRQSEVEALERERNRQYYGHEDENHDRGSRSIHSVRVGLGQGRPSGLLNQSRSSLLGSQGF
ncbi:hypothetical protein EDD11_004959 [Mortierella claussenii]|nr:hypothetical protein EDD11_004959 [Mortierella claussenii]